MDWKLTKTPCSPWALTEAQLGISISISGRQLPGCQCLHHIFLASTEIQAMTILHSPVEKNVAFRSNFMSVGREHEHKRMQMSIIQKFWVGERRNHQAVWELHPSVCEVRFVDPVKCVWFVFLRLEVEVRKLFLYQYRLFTSYMQSHFINDRKGKKWEKKKKDFLQLYLDFIVSSTFQQSSYCPGKKVLAALECPPRNPTASPSLGFPVTLTRDRASSWRYCSHKS